MTIKQRPQAPEPAAPASADSPRRAQHVNEHLANERTFLAWVRTAVAIIGLGFVVAKFALYLKQLATGTGEVTPTSSRSALLGVVLVGLGAVTVLLALSRYLLNRHKIEHDTYSPTPWLDISISVLIAGGAITMMFFLLTSTR